MTNSLNQKSLKLLKMVIFGRFLAITHVWDSIETWGFHMDDPCDFPDSPISAHNNVTKSNIMQPLKNGKNGN